MVSIVTACSRVCKGLIAFVVNGQTDGFSYSCTPELLTADLKRKGFIFRHPSVFHRVGIPGSGGPDWLRGDWEPILCLTRPGRLPWSDPTAYGHPPKYREGGAASYRLRDGKRVGRPHICQGRNGRHKDSNGYIHPAVANPGNVIHCRVGGGHLGSPLAHKNEAPFPERLAEFFILSFCRPGGVVLDPFCGSGTTVAVAHRHDRHGIGIDIRESQIELSRKRLEGVTPLWWSNEADSTEKEVPT
jgi:site-specific DNA-methyltransferase (adenine-specific)/site-specific DNA-methyltransferase (cytosine-N4-specific)